MIPSSKKYISAEEFNDFVVPFQNGLAIPLFNINSMEELEKAIKKWEKNLNSDTVSYFGFERKN